MKVLQWSDIGKLARATTFALKDKLTTQALEDFNRILTEVVLDACKDKKRIGVTLTAGRDTRTILAILLNHQVQIKNTLTTRPTEIRSFNKDDISVASRISADFCLAHRVVERWEGISEDYDVIYGGYLMSNYANVFLYANRLDKNIAEAMNGSQKNPKLAVPMLNPRVITSIRRVPFYLRMDGAINRHVIRRNAPELLKYSFSRS